MVQKEKVAKLHPNLLFSLNIFLELTLFGLFLVFFGIPSVSKYLSKETIVKSSVEDTNGIEAPAITIIARQTNDIALTLGWKTVDKNISSIQNFKIVHHCKEINLTNLNIATGETSPAIIPYHFFSDFNFFNFYHKITFISR